VIIVSAVVNISHEKDPEILRQVATILDNENRHLHTRLQKALKELSQLKNEDPSRLQQELIRLQEQLDQRNHMLFGDSSEKSPRGNTDKPESKKPQRGHGPRPQPELKTVEKFFELDEPDKTCPQCGGELSELKDQFEESEEITVVRRHFVVEKQKRKKYSCKCGGCIETAPGPDKLKAGGRYSIDFAINVALDKYLAHLPLERQVGIMKREGLSIDSQTLWDQIEYLARLHDGLPERMRQYILSKDIIGADETTWRLLAASKKDKRKKWCVWSVCAGDGVMYRIVESKSAQSAKEILGQYHGILMTDGNAVYEKLRRERDSHFILAHCWAHVRRKFVQAEKSYPIRSRAIVNLIADLYALEKKIPEDLDDNDARNAWLTERRKYIIDALQVWMLDLKTSSLPTSSIGQAANYARKIWAGLTVVLDHPEVPLDNNGVERAIRGLVVGRKNHYGSRSRRGTEVAAVFYTICESAKLNDIDPHEYLKHITLAALKNEYVPLPHEFAAMN